jgi:hypothetical protein
MEFLKKHGINLLVLLILSGMTFLRLTSYGDLRLSVANGDTDSYIQGGAAPLFSTDMLTRPRLFTTNLFYYLANVQECEIHAISYPAIQTETHRGIQPCFDRIVVFQNILSCFAWSMLAWVVSKRLSGGYEKLLAAILIPAFGFAPAIADWDSVLGSESLTFSLFAISLALVIETCFLIGKEKFPSIVVALAVVTLGFWAFTRDANIYTVGTLLGVSIITVVFIPKFRRDKKLLISIAAILVITVVGLQSAMLSRRWQVPLTNVFNDLLLPYPARVEFLQGMGMPDPNSVTYSEWFVEQAPRVYARFLLSHIGYTLSAFTKEISGIFAENTQPYFYTDETFARVVLTTANDILHPKTHLIFVLNILLVAGMSFAAFRRRNQRFLRWFWIGMWLFVSALLTMGVGFFADSIGVTRHTMFAVEMFRLMTWLFILILLDHANRADPMEA